MTKTSKLLEDLLWVIKSPSLVNPYLDHSLAKDLYVIDQLDPSPVTKKLSATSLETQLKQHLSNNKSHFLGPYFEQLWRFYLEHHPGYRLIASNQQIHNQGKTIGEFDFLVQDLTNRNCYHQELAIKFYLGCEHHGEALWIGPQSVDRFDKKMSHLLKQQLKLAQQHEARETLHQLSIKQTSAQLLMKGYLFQPAHLNPVPLPDYANPKHLSGHWLPRSLFIEAIQKGKHHEDQWQVLQKQEWFSQHAHLNPKRIYSSENLIQQLDFSRPILLSRVRFEEQGPTELGKLFIVSDDWPNLPKTTPAL